MLAGIGQRPDVRWRSRGKVLAHIDGQKESPGLPGFRVSYYHRTSRSYCGIWPGSNLWFTWLHPPFSTPLWIGSGTSQTLYSKLSALHITLASATRRSEARRFMPEGYEAVAGPGRERELRTPNSDLHTCGHRAPEIFWQLQDGCEPIQSNHELPIGAKFGPSVGGAGVLFVWPWWRPW